MRAYLDACQSGFRSQLSGHGVKLNLPPAEAVGGHLVGVMAPLLGNRRRGCYRSAVEA
jgi:hypothetical protein